MNRLSKIISIAAFSTMVLLLPAIASAQYYPNGNQYPNDPYGRNGGYNNGGYGNGQYGSYGDMRSTVRNLKSRARDFQRQLDRDLDRSRLNGTRREDQMNQLADRFKDAVNDLDNDGYNNGRYNSNADRELRRVFDAAGQIERTISRSGVSYQSQNIWSSIRNDLQVLSRVNGVNPNTRGNGRNNGGWGNGNGNGNGNGGWGNGRNNNGNRNGLPSWWPF